MNGQAQSSGYHFGYKMLMLALFAGGRPPDWREDAACRGVPPETFVSVQNMAKAKELCAGCPVLAACRADQLAWEKRNSPTRSHPVGVVGGLTGAERRDVHYPPAEPPPPTARLALWLRGTG
ncbi:WhiB family transcriptional regulator [Crossiella sp. CA198]|uniref:WhiB family transcriptional regulator n=1 Tax=Crossiella sp. CA198 TaxID=3455607 RepID=UPI003F8D40CA